MKARNPRREIVRYTRWLAREGLITGSEGNLSLHLGDRILITPSGRLKAELSVEDLAEVSPEGTILCGRPTSELPMHLAVYRQNPEIRAVVHTHPPYTLALSLSGFDFRKHYLAEGALLLGEIAVVPYLPPGSEELARAVAEVLDETRVAVLERHGAVTAGRDLHEAVNLSLILEKVCRVVYLAKTLGADPVPLET
ncbi:class II aldolase/adducin family protein [Thermosulfurimonas sp. F29]|uniref:class II aldolase/adducin family protein n=1 Tax=Thermosulfurimonas sp. F29 TaxID=2867247 RepID=UPI001C829B4E|nr:class II aldolase/adducin family protein [Thermosulfurimonas sp. F29]MBX6422732.1 class II aldolase/adducin family protein [Thermosulfurimonas sp. F29]